MKDSPLQPEADGRVRSSAWLGDGSRRYALDVEREHRAALESAHRADLEALAMLLIQKRTVDGLNGRRWDAGAHLYFEEAIASMLARVKSPNAPSSSATGGKPRNNEGTK